MDPTLTPRPEPELESDDSNLLWLDLTSDPPPDTSSEGDRIAA